VERVNVFSIATCVDPSDPDGYRAGMARFGPQIGAAMLGGSIYDLPAGQSICPFHCEYGNEEWLIVIAGRPTLRRVADGVEVEEEFEPGDTLCFPPGREGAHKVTNRGEAMVRVLMLSTMADPSVSYYPDSDKFGIWPGDKRDNLLVRRENGVEYYDGEV
jgi:uncharacterized cupin superfamily protein